MFNKFFVISSEDFKKSNGIYFINTSVISPAIQQLLELKLLEYFYMVENVWQIFIAQNNIPFGFSYYKL